LLVFKTTFLGVPSPRGYMYIIYTPNLGFGITLFDRGREQGRFRGSSEGAGESIEEQGRASREPREHRGSV